jgi:hypothetical protein
MEPGDAGQFIGELLSREALCVHHELERFNTLTPRGDTRISGRGRSHSKTSRDHSGDNGEQSGLAHLSLPLNPAHRDMR